MQNKVSQTLLKALDNASNLYDKYKNMDVSDIKSEIAILNTTATLAKTYIDNEKLETKIVNLVKNNTVLANENE